MTFFSDSSRVVNALILLGAVAGFFALLAGGSAAWKISRAFLMRTPPVIERGTMGQEGVACGGPERLPCEPGYVCDTDDDETYGVCIEDARETFPLGGEGVICGGGRGCQPGLVCNAVGGAAGVCIKPGAR